MCRRWCHDGRVRQRFQILHTGMWIQAMAIGLFATGASFWHWPAASILLGIGTAMVFPTLLAAVSDMAHPEWRASAVGVYRLWRDGGYAVGSLLSGALADGLYIPLAIAATGVITCLSGTITARGSGAPCEACCTGCSHR